MTKGLTYHENVSRGKQDFLLRLFIFWVKLRKSEERSVNHHKILIEIVSKIIQNNLLKKKLFLILF